MNNILPQSPENKPINSNSILKAALALVILIAFCLAYMLFESKETMANQEEVINAKVMELANTRIKLDSITFQLDQQIAEVNQLGGDIGELQRAKAALEQDKVELTKNYSLEIATIKENFNEKIKGYETILRSKEAELVKLREENEQLSSENSNLKSEKMGLSRSVDEIRARSAEVASQNRVLKEKVTKAAALRVESLKVIGVTYNGKEFEDDRYKARKLEKIKLSVQLVKNELTEKGKKTVFIRILDPDGSTLFDTDMGSGTISMNGQDIGFTIRREINFDNENLHYDFIYHRGIPFRSGNYAIEMYAEGFKIGAGGFEVK